MMISKNAFKCKILLASFCNTLSNTSGGCVYLSHVHIILVVIFVASVF